MTKRVEKLLEQLKNKEYTAYRKTAKDLELTIAQTPDEYAKNFGKTMEAQDPVLLEEDRFGFYYTLTVLSPNVNGNVSPDYGKVIGMGFEQLAKEVKDSMEKIQTCSEDAEQVKEKLAMGQAMLDCIKTCMETASKYRAYAKEKGATKLYEALLKIPAKGAETFYEACLFLKMCTYFLRVGCTSHLGLARFDQYMYPYYLADKKKGVTDEEILELIEEFYISINFDTDLYQGVQKGDNGQSMVLGGFDRDGNSMYNELSRICLQASMELQLIDPKINLRVGKKTPDEIFEYATHLTKLGLGFPQYCNDDVVVEGLCKLGYDYEDALNYVVAACWEYIIPGCDAGIPNIDVMDFPAVVGGAIREHLEESDTFEILMKYVKRAVKGECDRMVEQWSHDRHMPPLPLLSLFFEGCIKELKDMWSGGTKYQNYGSHGAGIANGADALAAIKKLVYEEQVVTKEQLLTALEADFVGYSELRNRLKNAPKMGNNDAYVDEIAYSLMDTFAENLNNRPTGLGGIWRAGTGSAMEYLWKGEKCPATADGRGAGEPYSSSFSPSLDARTNGLLSVIQSFTGYDMTKIINGGPLTLEIHDTVFRNDLGIMKTAMLVKEFVNLGGHQLQLNAINRERLLDAQKNPQNYPNLIVRVWGWSGYFCELDVKYQNHIIRRTQYTG